jgi:hypothetical protein
MCAVPRVASDSMWFTVLRLQASMPMQGMAASGPKKEFEEWRLPFLQAQVPARRPSCADSCAAPHFASASPPHLQPESARVDARTVCSHTHSAHALRKLRRLPPRQLRPKSRRRDFNR